MAVLALTVAGCGGDGDSTQQASAATHGPTDSTNTAVALVLNGQWPLTGGTLDGDPPARPVYVVKIDNTEASSPQVGLGSADMIVEELVEGGLTRLAVFFYQDVPADVGPVRSMRASDIGIVKPVAANLVASGGANPTIRRLATADVHTFTEGATGFYRDDTRSAPYNLFVKLSALAAHPPTDWRAPPAPYLPFGSADDFAGQIPVTSIAATFSGGHTTDWQYTDAGWTRPGSYAASGDDFVADNVLLLKVKVGDAGYLDPAGNPVPETEFFGSGEAVLVHGDKALKCTWSKQDKADALSLKTADGESVSVPAGHTWIELVPADSGSVTLGK